LSNIGDAFTYTFDMFTDSPISIYTPILYEISGFVNLSNITERDLEEGRTFGASIQYMYGYVPDDFMLNRRWFDRSSDIWE